DEAFFRPPAPVVPPSATLVPTTGPESVSTPILLGPPISPAISHYSWIITYTIVYADWGSGPLRRRKFGTMRVSVDPIDRIVAYDNDETLNGGPDDITLSAIVNNDDAIELLVDFHNSL